MNELEIKIQSYLDGELDGSGRKEVERLLEKDATARMLLEELRLVRQLVSENEPQPLLPESRDFYWSKISRAIEAEEKSAARTPAAPISWWRLGWARPLALFGSLCLILAAILFFNPRTGAFLLSEMETATDADSMDSITYRSDDDGNTVVYLFNREPEIAIDSEEALIQ